MNYVILCDKSVGLIFDFIISFGDIVSNFFRVNIIMLIRKIFLVVDNGFDLIKVGYVKEEVFYMVFLIIFG